jgi:predicted transcriptional regulator
VSEVRLHVESLDRFADRSLEVARRLDRGNRRAGRMEIAFETAETLLKVLTPNRWVLLRTLKRGGRMSIRALATSLRRDYRGVHADVVALAEVGLIDRGAGGIAVPWSRITAEMDVDAAA